MEQQQPQDDSAAFQQSKEGREDVERPPSPLSPRASEKSDSVETPTGLNSTLPAPSEDDQDITPPAVKKPNALPPAAIDPNIGMNAQASAPAMPSFSAGPPSSWSQASDRQLGHSSASSVADSGDRVYPIRSVVSVDQSQQTPFTRNSGEHEYFPRFDPKPSDRQRPNNARAELESIRRSDTAPAFGGRRDPGTTKGNLKSTKSSSINSPNERPPIPLFRDDSSDEGSTKTSGGASSLGDYGSASASAAGEPRTPGEFGEQLYATRFKHVMTDEGHYVITGRDGNLERCEDEPIHMPGAVQSFGLLVALKEESDGRFTVRVVSENSERFLGYSPQQLFKLDNFLDLFSEEQADNMLDHIDFIKDEDADVALNGPEVFSLSLRPPKRRSIKMWCAIHISPSNPDYIVCEFELENDLEYPLRAADEVTPPVPEDTLYQQPSLEEYNESTENSSKPLRVLRSARKKRGEAGAMQVFDIMSQVQEQLAAAPDLDKFLKILVGIVKELTGFHRVMVYQFDSSYNGKVVTELVDPTQTRDLYKGLHFPASDIPRQARELYKINKVRLLYDRDLESARLVCRTQEDMEKPLDLTHAYLRAMSPIHLKYLANMAVRASMSISINAFSELWGLIACHSYGPRGMRVAFPIRKMCRLIGDTASRNIERLSYASRLQARKLINTVPTDKNPSGYIIASSEDLLKLFDADFGMLSIRGETKILGKLEKSQEALAMLEYLRLKKYSSVVSSQDIAEDFPDLKYQPGFSVIAGMLYVPLSVGGQDFIAFFRRGQVKEVKWAGNPYEKVIKEGTSDYLVPRTSFQVWHETIIGKCRDWSEEQIETAAVLCLVYGKLFWKFHSQWLLTHYTGKFIEVWRQKEQALQNSRLTRLLLANSAHEVRTPLNAIINYLEIALEGSLDQETRENLAKSHSASKSLIYVINDLLDLTKTEEGQELIKDEILDLPACLKEATDPFKMDAKRKGIGYSVVEHPGLPHKVHGDHRRVRQAIANLTANAVEHTTQGSVQVECFVTEVINSRVKIEVVVQDTGRGMSNAKLDALFQELEQVSSDEAFEDAVEKAGDDRALGLGLAVVARTVRNMDGQLRLKSEEGVGSRFVIQLPFDLPSDDSAEPDTLDHQSAGQSSLASVTRSLPPTDGEVTLINHGSSIHTATPGSHGLRQSRSFDDSGSVQSLKSATSLKSANSLKSAVSMGSVESQRSDADRLIDALSTPLSYGDGEPDSVVLRRQSSDGPGHAHRHSSSSLRSVPGSSHSEDRSNRPGPPARSTTSPQGLSAEMQQSTGTGVVHVQDSRTPIKAIKMPDEDFEESPSGPQTSSTSGVLFEIPDKPKKETVSDQSPANAVSGNPGKLRVLIAEDDPVNMKILRKRLEKVGHDVVHTVNGEDCATVYSERCQDFDIVLMDMQVCGATI